jgi:hypothetical protein
MTWLLIWGGMFTGFYNIVVDGWMSAPLSLFQGIRAFFPLLALYICMMWVFTAKMRFPKFLTPLGLFFYYGLVGFVISFLSPDPLRSLYWASLFLAPVLAVWICRENEETLDSIRTVVHINYATAIGLFLIILFKIAPKGLSVSGLQFYELPFGLGEMNANGVGRFSLIVIIIGGVRFFFTKSKVRFAWLGLFFMGVYLLMITQSRTALLGLGVASVLFVFTMGFRWYYVLAGPLVSFIIWQSGYRSRAKGEVRLLMNLSGRESTWSEAFALIKKSPILGWGFHSDRIMLESQHIHNSYIHATIHSGILGLILFTAAVVSIWYVILREKVIRRVGVYEGNDKPLLMECLLLIGFFSARSLFESTAAFFGVDLLLFIPAIVFLYKWAHGNYDRVEEPGDFAAAPQNLKAQRQVALEEFEHIR